MGASKRHQRTARAAPPTRRTTRSSKGRLLTGDPAENAQQLEGQLRPLGLYAADTVGDGNCLFRALSDQLYGTEARHAQLRQDICAWIEQHKARYAPFVDDERGIDVHLRCMRTLATYGGHLELTAFAHMARRDIKVVQPGLVYIIEWSSGWEPDALAAAASSSSSSLSTCTSASTLELTDDRSRRAARRERRKAEKEKAGVGGDDEDDEEWRGPVYVAYHDWEHFSSIRNLRGPHAGVPRVRELPPDEARDLPPPPPSKSKRKPASKARSAPVAVSAAPQPQPAPPPLPVVSPHPLPTTPAHIPLPPSRSPSPLRALPAPRDHRSPKRTFDESSASSSNSSGAAKRSRTADEPPDDDDDTPALSDVSSLSSDPDSAPATPAPQPPPPPPPPPLTRRQRKALGMPKQRTARSAGKIVIPGGRYKRPAQALASARRDEEEQEQEQEEWARNGAGRVDVRGFRELRI
ncbi:hypothetical protein K488DRAFT_74786 [Vararia minispora EC-137]|uniref:Uncharacterized protein n=1 Tax=Vararia minispora EC-137 TaxID=1314806 RepID=A0ACB8Q612_9AGAM|nr:hypothetical protein K488DRAFT_74786 [Vararia minispora EC-137]